MNCCLHSDLIDTTSGSCTWRSRGKQRMLGTAIEGVGRMPRHFGTHPSTHLFASELAYLHLRCEEPDGALDLSRRDGAAHHHWTLVTQMEPGTLLGQHPYRRTRTTNRHKNGTRLINNGWVRKAVNIPRVRWSPSSMSVDETDAFGKAQHLIEIALGNDGERR